MCNDIIDLIAICFKCSGSEIHFFLARQLRTPPREMVYTEHLTALCFSVIVLETIAQRFVVRGLQYTVLNIVATGTAECKELLTAQFVDISTHKVIDVVADFVGFPAVKIDDLKLLTVESIKVFVVAVNIQNSKRLFAQPLEPVALVLVVIVPNTSLELHQLLERHNYLRIERTQVVRYISAVAQSSVGVSDGNAEYVEHKSHKFGVFADFFR